MNDTDRSRKFGATLDHARDLSAEDRTESFDDLAGWLNANGFRTCYGGLYVGGRGTARLIRAVYYFARNELGLGDDGAYPVAAAFTNRRGYYAYE